MSAETATRDRSINRTLIESAKEAISDVLGEKAARVLFVYLENHRNVTLDETPYNLEALFSTLEEIFGDNGKAIARFIIRKLYVKLALQFIEQPDHGYLEYIEDALQELNRRQDNFRRFLVQDDHLSSHQTSP